MKNFYSEISNLLVNNIGQEISQNDLANFPFLLSPKEIPHYPLMRGRQLNQLDYAMIFNILYNKYNEYIITPNDQRNPNTISLTNFINHDELNISAIDNGEIVDPFLPLGDVSMLNFMLKTSKENFYSQIGFNRAQLKYNDEIHTFCDNFLNDSESNYIKRIINTTRIRSFNALEPLDKFRYRLSTDPEIFSASIKNVINRLAQENRQVEGRDIKRLLYNLYFLGNARNWDLAETIQPIHRANRNITDWDDINNPVAANINTTLETIFRLASRELKEYLDSNIINPPLVILPPLPGPDHHANLRNFRNLFNNVDPYIPNGIDADVDMDVIKTLIERYFSANPLHQVAIDEDPLNFFNHVRNNNNIPLVDLNDYKLNMAFLEGFNYDLYKNITLATKSILTDTMYTIAEYSNGNGNYFYLVHNSIPINFRQVTKIHFFPKLIHQDLTYYDFFLKIKEINSANSTFLNTAPNFQPIFGPIQQGRGRVDLSLGLSEVGQNALISYLSKEKSPEMVILLYMYLLQTYPGDKIITPFNNPSDFLLCQELLKAFGINITKGPTRVEISPKKTPISSQFKINRLLTQIVSKYSPTCSPTSQTTITNQKLFTTLDANLDKLYKFINKFKENIHLGGGSINVSHFYLQEPLEEERYKFASKLEELYSDDNFDIETISKNIPNFSFDKGLMKKLGGLQFNTFKSDILNLNPEDLTQYIGGNSNFIEEAINNAIPAGAGVPCAANCGNCAQCTPGSKTELENFTKFFINVLTSKKVDKNSLTNAQAKYVGFIPYIDNMKTEIENQLPVVLIDKHKRLLTVLEKIVNYGHELPIEFYQTILESLSGYNVVGKLLNVEMIVLYVIELYFNLIKRTDIQIDSDKQVITDDIIGKFKDKVNCIIKNKLDALTKNMKEIKEKFKLLIPNIDLDVVQDYSVNLDLQNLPSNSLNINP